MATARINAESLLAIDVGAVSTRTMLFDDVEGRYRFLGAGIASTTANAPFKDVLEGIRQSLERLQRITGRVLVDDDERLIVPSRPDGAGIDVVAATISAGPPLKVLILGLLEDISQESAKNLARTTYTRVVESIGLKDQTAPAEFTFLVGFMDDEGNTFRREACCGESGSSTEGPFEYRVKKTPDGQFKVMDLPIYMP